MEQHCAFCGKAESEVKKLISSGTGICICDECVAVCNDILDTTEDVSKPEKTFHLPTPQEIKRQLDHIGKRYVHQIEKHNGYPNNHNAH